MNALTQHIKNKWIMVTKPCHFAPYVRINLQFNLRSTVSQGFRDELAPKVNHLTHSKCILRMLVANPSQIPSSFNVLKIQYLKNVVLTSNMQLTFRSLLFFLHILYRTRVTVILREWLRFNKNWGTIAHLTVFSTITRFIFCISHFPCSHLTLRMMRRIRAILRHLNALWVLDTLLCCH